MQTANRDGTIWADLFWDDLSPETQKELSSLMDDNGNFDVFPIASINIGKEE
jgi:hypothetical protein